MCRRSSGYNLNKEGLGCFCAISASTEPVMDRVCNAGPLRPDLVVKLAKIGPTILCQVERPSVKEL